MGTEQFDAILGWMLINVACTLGVGLIVILLSLVILARLNAIEKSQSKNR